MGFPVEGAENVDSRNELLPAVELVEHHHGDDHLGLSLPHVELGEGAAGRGV